MLADDDDDWRYRKAQQLGLIDTRPVGPQPAREPGRRPVAAPPAVPVSRRPAPPVVAAPRAISRIMLICSAIAALLVAAAAGWLLRGPTLSPEPAVTATAFPADPIIAPATDVRETSPKALPYVPVIAPIAAPVPSPQIESAAIPPALIPPALIPPAPILKVPRADREAPRATRSERAAARQAGPSFDCRRAPTRVHQMICDRPDLAVADNRMARAYQAAIQRSASDVRLERDQAKFLNARGACESARCVGAVTWRRIRALDRTTGR